ncbi:MAG TPA: TetR/AcrR family transcriptional regulator [Candidatus Sulfomarinibacteraceae bacterium]|nr:TetR/AcrR family transcriptional regulator [Candidatus Sulfomarinibacteraceae bacterium]
MSETRTYRKKARAESEKATGEAILEAATAAFAQEAFDRVTLQRIADDSDVTVQTVLRRFDSKEKLFETVAERETARILASREVADDAGLPAALGALLHHYEQDGDMILKLVAQEHLFDPVREIVERGRRVHREWVEKYCGNLLRGSQGAERARLLHAAIVATDLGTWKLLRRDLGLERSEVAAVMMRLLDGLKGEN